MAARLGTSKSDDLESLLEFAKILIINFSFSANSKNSYYLEINLQLIFI